eukprot:g6699.t1
MRGPLLQLDVAHGDTKCVYEELVIGEMLDAHCAGSAVVAVLVREPSGGLALRRAMQAGRARVQWRARRAGAHAVCLVTSAGGAARAERTPVSVHVSVLSNGAHKHGIGPEASADVDADAGAGLAAWAALRAAEGDAAELVADATSVRLLAAQRARVENATMARRLGFSAFSVLVLSSMVVWQFWYIKAVKAKATRTRAVRKNS